MGDLYSIHPGITRAGQNSTLYSANDGCVGTASALEISDLIKSQIASHPRYPSLLSAYIECRKVGAPPEIATLLEDIRRAGYPSSTSSGEIGADPELDEFMEAYCRVLMKYKEELSKPFHEATTFLTEVEAQLRSLCSSGCTAAAVPAGPFSSQSDEAAGSSEEELSCVDIEATEGIDNNSRMADHELKEMLLKKYSGYLSNLRKEFLKKRKKGKLPKDARMALLDWWNNHYRWPYPTDEEKVKLAELTGLDQKQINNWFINQRKRHWKPSDDMRMALMEGVSGGSSGTMLYFDTGTVGP